MPLSARRLALAFLLSCAAGAAFANNTPQTLPFSQDWSNTGLITANDNWSGVPGIEGFRGDGLAATSGVDPQTIVAADSPGAIDVNANQANPSTFTTGGVTEFDLADDAVALSGSTTARAPYLKVYLNTTGASGINVAYNLRDIDGSTDNAVQPVALQYRIGNSGDFINVPAAFVADASSGPSLATLVTPVSVPLPAAVDNQPLVELRIITSDAVGSDEWIGIDDIAITAGGGGGNPVLTVTDTSAAEGDSSTTTFFFTFNLSQPAGVGGVSIDYATADGTATVASDYAGVSATASIAQGNSSVTIGVDVNGDLATEPNETFFVNITGATGATLGDAQGLGTINNDDVTVTPIHAIQGSGASSPLLGQSVSTVGIVTGRKGNGFFLQTTDGEADADAATSQGVFVFTGAAPPAAAAVGNRVLVAGTVAEFVPTQDPLQPPLTELTGATVTQLSTGNPLPTAVTLTANLPDPAGAFDQLERLEGMRVTIPSLTVAAPTDGNTNEVNATGTSNGVFHGVVTGVARPFREPGIQAPDPAPAGSSIPPLPRWDFNPELLAIDSDALGASTLNVSTGAVLTDVTGPLDYGFRRYTVLPEATPALTAGPAPSAARLPTADEFTVVAYNLQRFFDTVNDPAIGEPVLTTTAFNTRLNKASLAIRNALNAPDIIGVVEVENLSTLQALAAKINADAVAASQPDPQYVAYLQEGNDVGGIDVGFLVKSAEVAAGIGRVEVGAVTQQGKDTTWIDPTTGAPSLLNDRPPLVLEAVVHYADGRKFPITVVAVHQRSLNGIDDETPSGPTTNGDRVRQKRQKQAEFLAGLIDGMQTADPGRRITVLGDFNAFEFNDGYVDPMNVVTGTPTPDNQTAVPGDGVDLVAGDLLNLVSTVPADQRYTFMFGGNAQSIDHILINQALGVAAAGVGFEHARINADFPEVNRNDANSPSRLSDHDPVAAYFQAPPLRFADLATTASATPANVAAGATMTFATSVTNDGPDAADFPGVGFAFDAEIPGLNVTAPSGWACDTPSVGNGTTTLSCAAASLANAAMASFQLTAPAPANRNGRPINLAVLATSQTDDPDTNDNDAAATLNVIALSADLRVLISVPAVLRKSSRARFVAAVFNLGPDAAPMPRLKVTLDVPSATVTAFDALSPGWNCTIAPIATFEAECVSANSLGMSNRRRALFNLVTSGPFTAPFVDYRAEASSLAGDPQPADNIATARVPVE